MRNQLITLAACLSLFSFSACKHTQQTTSTAAELETVMSVPATVKVGAPVMVTFTVHNNSSKELQFLKWQTPFEGRFLDPFFDIQDSKGEAVQYQGVMAKRIMPPPADAYIKVAAKDKVSSEIDVLKAYKITAPGKYKISYHAGGVSGLNKVNEATFTVTE